MTTEAEREGRWVLSHKTTAGHVPVIGPEGVARMPTVVLTLASLEKGRSAKDASTATHFDEQFAFMLHAHSAVEIAEELLAQARRVLTSE